MKAGDHVRIRVGAGWRHGIDAGDRTVIYFEPGEGVKRARFESFGDRARVEVVTHTERVYAPKMVVARAFSRFAESAYAAMFADSEAFAVWCKTGRLAPRAALAAWTVPAAERATPGGPPRRARRAAAAARPSPRSKKKAAPRTGGRPSVRGRKAKHAGASSRGAGAKPRAAATSRGARKPAAPKASRSRGTTARRRPAPGRRKKAVRPDGGRSSRRTTTRRRPTRSRPRSR